MNIESARNYLIEEEFKNCTFNSEEFYEKFNPKLEYRICISGEALRFILDRVKQIDIVYKNEIYIVQRGRKVCNEYLLLGTQKK